MTQAAHAHKVTGGCHCGAVRFAAELPSAKVRLIACNCSICTKSGYLHLNVPHKDFVLVQGRESLAEYRFNTQQAVHYFCTICGTKSFYQPRSHPEAYSVNVHCLDAGHGLDEEIIPFDGAQWEQSRSSLNI
jgi:hypothetical protein